MVNLSLLIKSYPISVPTMEDLHSFGCLTPKKHCRFSKEKTEGERKKERKNEWPRQFPAWPDISSQAVTCSVLVYSWTRLVY